MSLMLSHEQRLQALSFFFSQQYVFPIYFLVLVSYFGWYSESGLSQILQLNQTLERGFIDFKLRGRGRFDFQVTLKNMNPILCTNTVLKSIV